MARLAEDHTNVGVELVEEAGPLARDASDLHSVVHRLHLEDDVAPALAHAARAFDSQQHISFRVAHAVRRRVARALLLHATDLRTLECEWVSEWVSERERERESCD